MHTGVHATALLLLLLLLLLPLLLLLLLLLNLSALRRPPPAAYNQLNAEKRQCTHKSAELCSAVCGAVYSALSKTQNKMSWPLIEALRG